MSTTLVRIYRMWRLASEPLCKLIKQNAQDYVIIELEARVMLIQSASLGIMAGIRENDLYFYFY